MAGFVPDSTLLILMKDDRVVRQQGQIHLAIQKNLTYLDEVPDLLWNRMAAVCQGELLPKKLRSDSIHAGLVSSAYMRRKFLEKASPLPLSLCR